MYYAILYIAFAIGVHVSDQPDHEFVWPHSNFTNS